MTKLNLLAGVEAMEAATFRLGHVARRLLNDHPDLPVLDIEPTAWAMSHGTHITAYLEVTPKSLDGASAWAHALGVEAAVQLCGKPGTVPYRKVEFETEVDGVLVKVMVTGAASDDERTAWATQEAPAPAEETSAA